MLYRIADMTHGRFLVPTGPGPKVPTDWEGDPPAARDGELPTDRDGDPPAARDGELPTDRDGDPPTDRDGDPPTDRDGELPKAGVGDPPAARDGELPTDRDGDPPAARDGELPTDRDGEPPTDRDGELPTDRDGELPKAGVGDPPTAACCGGVVSPTKGSGRHSPTYEQVLEDVNRLSHLLGRFLQAADGLVGANAAARRRPRLSAGEATVPPASPQRRDSGARSGTHGRKLAAERPSSGTAAELVSEALAEHEWRLAAAGGDLGRMAALLDSEPGLLNRKDPVSGLTAAHWFAKHGNGDALLQLGRLASGRGLQLQLNCRAGGAGYTPLHLAAMQGHQMVIKLLVGAYDADVDARDYSGRKAWQYLGSAMPGKLRQLIGGEEEPPAVPPRSREVQDQVDSPPKKPEFFSISSIQRFFQPALWRWRKTRHSID